MTERLELEPTFAWTTDSFLHTAYSRIADASLIAASTAAIRSSQALLQRPDLGTQLPGFETS
jgi:hypothetical protein